MALLNFVGCVFVCQHFIGSKLNLIGLLEEVNGIHNPKEKNSVNIFWTKHVS